ALSDTNIVGTEKPVTILVLTVTGPDAGNYCYVIGGTTADITPRPLDFTFSGGNKTYDAKLEATLTPADNRISGDVLTVHYASALFNDKNVGSAKPVTVSGIAVTGPDAGNYA